MGIPSGNKNTKGEVATTSDMSPALGDTLSDEKEKLYQKIENKYKPRVAKMQEDQSKLEVSKVKTMYELGSEVNKLFDSLTNKQIAKTKQRFTAATGSLDNFVSVCAKFQSSYSSDDLDKILEARLNTNFVWALTTVENKKDASRILTLALGGKVSPKQIRDEIGKMKAARLTGGGKNKGPGSGKSLSAALKRSLVAVSKLPEVFGEYYDLEQFYDESKDKDIVQKVLTQLEEAEATVGRLKDDLNKLIS